MKERPILFSGPMVRATLEGRKTQTRRIVKPQPPFAQEDVYVGLDGIIRWRATGEKVDCPYGQPGDQLWVRETWRVADGGTNYLEYAACRSALREGIDEATGIKWKPSIHMPRWASRITLEITGVRVERLQDISDEDAKAEGAESIKHHNPPKGFHPPGWHSHRFGFYRLWESINGPGSWDANPWVWVIEFKKL